MKTSWTSLTVVASLLVVVGGVLAFRQPGNPPAERPGAAREAGEDVIALDAAPPAVRGAALRLAGETKNITAVIRESNKQGVPTYEIEYSDGTAKCAAILSEAGDVMETERAAAESSLPASALAALRRDYPGASFSDVQAVTVHTYEIEVVVDGKRHEVQVDASGTIKDPTKHEDEKKEGKKGKKEKKAGKDKKEGTHEDEGDDEH